MGAEPEAAGDLVEGGEARGAGNGEIAGNGHGSERYSAQEG